MEIWKKVDGYDNYSVSSEGRVRNDRTGRILKAGRDNDYLKVVLCKNGKTKSFSVHRLVAQAFIPNPLGLPCVDHINCVREDNRAENLKWCSYHENNSNPLTRKRNSEARKGKRSAFYGKHHSDEAKQKMSEPKSRAVVGINIENPSITVEYVSMAQAKKDGFHAGTICNCCKGKLKSHKGYFWCYKEDYVKFLESLK